MAHKAIVVGGSGLIGRLLIGILLQSAEYSEVISLGRKKINLKNNRLKQYVVDFDSLYESSEIINGDVIFCCLGSTRKKTPDLNEYRKIDHDYPLRLAEIGQRNGATQYHLVSAMGADAKSSNFYTKMKGETENSLIQIGMKSLFIYRPSVLTGSRGEKRLLEKIAIIFMTLAGPFLFGALKNYRPISARTVAMAMYKQSLKNKTGVHIYASDKIKRRA